MKKVWCGITIVLLFLRFIGVDIFFCIELGSIMMLLFVVEGYIAEVDKVFQTVITYVASTLLCFFAAHETADFGILTVYTFFSVIILLKAIAKRK